jgi:hypothetical protein
MRKCIALCPALALVVLALLARAAEDLPEDLAVAAARKRQESIKTLDVRFKHTETYAKGAVSDASRSNPNPPAPVPAEDISVESTNRIVIDGGRIRIEDNHPRWYERGERSYKHSEIAAFDGNNGYLLLQGEYGGKSSAQGTINNKTPALHVHFVPLFISIRGWNPPIGPRTITQLQTSGTSEKIGGDLCDLYFVPTKNESKTQYWLDAKRDYSVRRIRNEHSGKIDSFCNIQNAHDDRYGWLPKSWSYEEYSWKGKLLATHSFEILEMNINEPEPAELFTIQFPPGCRVHNQITKTEYVVGPDGTMRETDPVAYVPPPAKKTWFPPMLWIASAAALLFIVVLAVIIVRRGNTR